MLPLIIVWSTDISIICRPSWSFHKLFEYFFNSCREPLLIWKAQYRWPPRTNQFRSIAFGITNIINFFTKQATLMRRPTVLSLLLQFVQFPDSCKAYFPFCASWARSEGWTQTLDLGMAKQGLSHCATNGDPLVVYFVTV